MSNTNVCVLMSTYNGEKYLCSQIDSILSQKRVKVSLIVRDDGSLDNTTRILQTYKDKGLLNWYTGPNKGSAYSFWDLLMSVGDYEYYSFADQDDVWLEDKLFAAVSIIKRDVPFLYFSKKTLVDAELNKLGREDEYIRGVSLEYSLLKGFAAGCTMVFNKKLYNALIKYTPKVMTMHDSWILKVAGAIGTVFYDETPHILYRQHGKNVVGNQTKISNFKRHIKTNIKYRYDTDRSQMALQIIDNYGINMSQRDYKYTMYLANIRKDIFARLRLVMSMYFKTQSPLDIILFKLFFIFGWM